MRGFGSYGGGLLVGVRGCDLRSRVGDVDATRVGSVMSGPSRGTLSAAPAVGQDQARGPIVLMPGTNLLRSFIHRSYRSSV